MSAIELKQWPKTLHFERGGVRRLGEFVDRCGGQRAFIVCGRTVASAAILQRVRAALGARLVGVYDKAEAHTPLHTVIDGAAQLKVYKADIVVSVGGGSTIDTAKAIIVAAATGGTIEPYTVKRGAPHTPLPAGILPHIAVPTVPGSGSEIQPNAGVLDPATQAKMRLRDQALIPKLAVLDAELVALCGPSLTASTGLAAVARCVEALYSAHRNPFADGLALHGLRLLTRTLPLGISEPGNLDAREECQYGSIMSALATANAEVSVVHSVGLVIGGRYRLAHGIAHGILLPAAIRAFLPLLGDGQSLVVEALGGTAGAGDLAAQAADRTAKLMRDLNFQPLLRAHGIAQDDLASVAEEASRQGMMANAPRPVDAEQILQWLRSVW